MSSGDSRRWWIPLLLAIQFLTRIPVPGLAGLTAEQARSGLSRAVIWFPLVGAIVGCVTAATITLAESIWARPIAVLLALAVEARLTGAFHEDAVADFCDALGGGHDAESTRRIMKDSRIGSYGALGLLVAVGLRAALLTFVQADVLVIAAIASACFGRLLAVFVMALVPPLGHVEGLAKDVGGRTTGRDVLLACVIASTGLAGLIWVLPVQMAVSVIVAGLFIVWLWRLLLRRLGGSTGDCLGFAVYAGQLIVLLSVTAH